MQKANYDQLAFYILFRLFRKLFDAIITSAFDTIQFYIHRTKTMSKKQIAGSEKVRFALSRAL